ncbi:hypothetical protein [Streptomyces sp. NPDC001678]|uniref:hypothetical protein n=1 Tax=Streptomyces sp. NPDC001678 TaxID=3364599 RepID=UPI0036AD0514
MIATRAAADGDFIDRPALEAASGRPVRSDWRRAGPFWSSALDSHPATRRSIEILRGSGVRVLYGEGEWTPHDPGTGEARIASYPWLRALDALSDVTRVPDAPDARAK